jgi:excinuclease UvrABC nuclease subunit
VVRYLTPEQRSDLIDELRQEMAKAARDLEFERAANLRDEILRLETLTSAKKARRD